MTDQTVEEVISWELEQQKKVVKELEDTVIKHREVYSFPNERDGVPESWCWGSRDYTQVSVEDAMLGVERINVKIRRVEEDLSKKDIASALRWLLLVISSVRSVGTMWSSQSSVRAYRYIDDYRKKKSSIAKKPRLKNKPSKVDLLKFKDDFIYKEGHEHGWKKQAKREFKITYDVIKGILK